MSVQAKERSKYNEDNKNDSTNEAMVRIANWALYSSWDPWWSSDYHAGLPIESFGVQIPARAEIWFKISAPPVLPSQLSYDE